MRKTVFDNRRVKNPKVLSQAGSITGNGDHVASTPEGEDAGIEPVLIRYPFPHNLGTELQGSRKAIFAGTQILV